MSPIFDLHCHTSSSDGALTAEKLIDSALKMGLSGLSITDHDTVSAYGSAEAYAEFKNFPLLPGVEFSSSHLKESVHILAYGFNLKDPGIASLCLQHKLRREERFKQMIVRIKDRCPDFNESIIRYEGIPGRPHLARALMDLGLVSSMKEAFDRYLGEGKPCYVESFSPSVLETLKVIQKADGFSVIAHPHLIKNSQVLLDLLNMDFDGLEAYYANFSKAQCERWIKIGKRKDWLLTGGSDFHGENKPAISLGASYCDESTFQKLMERYVQNKKKL